MVLNAMIRNTCNFKRRPSHMALAVLPGASDTRLCKRPHAADMIERATA